MTAALLAIDRGRTRLALDLAIAIDLAIDLPGRILAPADLALRKAREGLG